MYSTTAQKLLALPVAAMIALATLLGAFFGIAFADDEGPDTTPVEPSELQLRVEQSAEAYNDAVAEVEDLQERIDANAKRIKKIEKALPEQKKRADAALVAIYKMSESGSTVAEVLMGIDDLGSFITTLDYLSGIARDNLEQIEELQNMREDLSEAQTQLQVEKKQAEKAVADAELALEEAKAAREEAAAIAAAAVSQEEIEVMREEVAHEAAEEARAIAEEQGATEEEAQAQADEAAANAASKVTAETVANGDVDWSVDKETFVNEWGDRIDEYLEGSPMEGQGANFASSAWDYGVDPRWSPAIANTESTKGEYTFADHNAWGWGSSSWDNWEDAIDDHVKGLADGYGSTISQESAEKYCPPDSESWYSDTLSEMNSI